MKTGIEIMAEERLRQVEKEGWTFEHDDQHTDGSLALAAASYAVAEDGRQSYKDDKFIPSFWPESWDEAWWKPTPNDRIHELAKAGALIAAEIDRLQRLNSQ